MDDTIRMSLQLEMSVVVTQKAAVSADGDFGSLDLLVEALAYLVAEAVWPETMQGAFLDFLVQDVLEFSTAIRSEARAERWTSAVSLKRSLHERSEYVVAAAIDAGFWDAYRDRMQKRIETDFRGKSRLMSEDARGIINSLGE